MLYLRLRKVSSELMKTKFVKEIDEIEPIRLDGNFDE